MKPLSRLSFLASLIGSVFLMTTVLMVTGCSRTPAIEQTVAASSDFNLMMWKADVAADFSRQEWKDFDAAVQEIKYGVMIAGEATGSARVWTATLAKMDGLTVRQVLQQGLGQKLARLTEERAKFFGYVTNNERLRVAPGDEASVDYLRMVRERQEERISLLTEQIKAIEEILQRRGVVLDQPPTKAAGQGRSEAF